MSLIALAGAEYGSMLEKGVTCNLLAPTTSGAERTGAYSFAYGSVGNNAGYVQLAFTGQNELFIQGCLYLNLGLYEDTPLNYGIVWRNGTTILGCLVMRQDNGLIEAWVGDKTTGTLVGTSSTAVRVGLPYMVFEVHVKIDGTDGVLEFKYDGTTEINFAGNTQPGADTTIDSVRYHCMRVNQVWGCSWDDLVICNPSGATNNSWIDGKHVYALRPNANGSSSQWTPSAGSNFQCVDEIPPSLTDHVITATPDHIDTYTFPDLPEEALFVAAIVPQFFGVKEGSPAITGIKRVQRDGGGDHEGSTINPLATLGTLQNEFLELNPNTGDAYTVAEVNALEMGFKAVA